MYIVFVFLLQDDITRLIEEGRLEAKLNELDKLERAAKNNPEPAWLDTIKLIAL